MLFAGVLYAWSILKAPLAAAFGWGASELALNFTLAMSFFCIGGLLGAQISKRMGHRIALILAGTLSAAGFLLTAVLQGGTVLAYTGDLGAGKTAFTRGLARGLGYAEPVTSPTYTIVNEYLGGRMPLFHFDMYRLASSDDLWDIGWEDYLERGGVCAVEWSENVDDAMENAVYVTIEKTGEESRRIHLEGGEFLADLSL